LGNPKLCASYAVTCGKTSLSLSIQIVFDRLIKLFYETVTMSIELKEIVGRQKED